MSRLVDNVFDGFEVGDEVEVTIRGRLGRIRSVVHSGEFITYVDRVFVPERAVQSVALIKPAEPKYVHGAPYQAADGTVYKYWNYGFGGGYPHWVGVGHEGPIPFEQPPRPMRKLVAE